MSGPLRGPARSFGASRRRALSWSARRKLMKISPAMDVPLALLRGCALAASAGQSGGNCRSDGCVTACACPCRRVRFSMLIPPDQHRTFSAGAHRLHPGQGRTCSFFSLTFSPLSA